MSAPVFATLGCRLNAYETEAMKELSAAAGVENAVIVNTCAVTAEAVRKAKQEIRRLSRENPGATIIVTGCAAQTEPETFAAMPEVDLVLGNAEKAQPGALNDTSAQVRVNDIMSVRETAGHIGRWRRVEFRVLVSHRKLIIPQPRKLGALLLFVTQLAVQRLLRDAIQAVAGVTEARHDVSVLV